MKTLFLAAILTCSAYACVNRADAINRAMEWVNAHVPYDANAYHGGYVQGCMGIVGYAWQFPKPGISAGHLIGTYCEKVTKASLLPGDIMTNPEAHELLFDGWADADKSHYVAIQLGGSKGSVKYVIPWPYWSNLSPEKYVPCKVLKACVTEEDIDQNIFVQ